LSHRPSAGKIRIRSKRCDAATLQKRNEVVSRPSVAAAQNHPTAISIDGVNQASQLLKEIQMKTIANIRTLSAIGALAFAAGLPVASYAAGEDARFIDSYNEGSEPVFMLPGKDTTVQALRAPQSTVAQVVDHSQSIDPFYAPHAPSAMKAQPSSTPATAQAASAAAENHPASTD